MSSDDNPWTWSVEHNDYYRTTYDANGNVEYHFSKAGGQDVQSSSDNSAAQSAQLTEGDDQISEDVGALDPAMPEPVPPHVRQNIPNLIAGTPNRGWRDLDPSYCMRTGADARNFFVRGRVFSMLFAETASETFVRNGTENTAITIGRFGQEVYSQIRRFIVVKVEHGFVYAIAIYTYSRRGATKRGCNPREHAPVFLQGQDPFVFEAEYNAGMTKEPIGIIPADPAITMDATSRVRFGKTYPVEWNVKVKDIGHVLPAHMRRLQKYWKEHNYPSDDPDVEDTDVSSYTTDPSSQHRYHSQISDPRFTPEASTPRFSAYNQPNPELQTMLPSQPPPGYMGHGQHYNQGYQPSHGHYQQQVHPESQYQSYSGGNYQPYAGSGYPPHPGNQRAHYWPPQ